MTTGISLLGQSQAQSSRLLNLQKVLTDLQRQATTQKKYETLSGFGADAQRVLRYRMDITNLEGYQRNTDIATTRMELMTNAMEQARGLGEQLINTIGGELLGGSVDTTAIQTIARNSLDFLQTLLNSDTDGRYLFSGSATNIPPMDNRGAIRTETQALVSDWLDGTITTSQLTASIRGMSDAAAGYAPGLTTAGPVSIRIEKNVEIDYTVLANGNGFDKMMKAMALAAALPLPDEATDVPDLAAFTDVLMDIQNLAREGVQEMIAATNGLSSKYAVAEQLREQQRAESAVLQKLLDKEENADQLEVFTKLQSMQTQLQASYEVTSIVSQLTLVNFLPV